MSYQYRNECHVHGCLVKDPIVKYTASGKCLANLTVVTKYQQHSEFHRITAWETLGEKVAQLKKGDFVRVVGRLQTRSWNDQASGQKKYTTEIVAFQVVANEKPTPLTPAAAKGGTAIAKAILRPAEGVRDADPF